MENIDVNLDQSLALQASLRGLTFVIQASKLATKREFRPYNQMVAAKIGAVTARTVSFKICDNDAYYYRTPPGDRRFSSVTGSTHRRTASTFLVYYACIDWRLV